MRLSEFKDEKAIEVVADLLEPIYNIVSNEANAEAKDEAKDKGVLPFAAAMLKNSAKDVMAMLAILDDKDPKEYHCNAATVLGDIVNMLSDDELLQLFGLQSETLTSAGSASANTEVENQ